MMDELAYVFTTVQLKARYLLIYFAAGLRSYMYTYKSYNIIQKIGTLLEISHIVQSVQ